MLRPQCVHGTGYLEFFVHSVTMEFWCRINCKATPRLCHPGIAFFIAGIWMRLSNRERKDPICKKAVSI